jgi:hypothetical protein
MTLINYIIQEKLNQKFDEIFNCEVDNRTSDLGFTDIQKLMIRPRPGTERISKMLSGTSGQVGQLFAFTDDDNVRSWYVAKGWEIYRFAFKEPWQFLGKFVNPSEVALLTVGPDNSYYIYTNALWIFSGGIASKSSKLWTKEFDNEADLTIEYPNPEDNLFTLLRDTNTVYYSAGGFWFPLEESYTLVAQGLWNNTDYPAIFNTVTLPKTIQITDTSGADGSTFNTVHVSAGLEATAASYVGSYLLLTSGVNKGRYSYIFNYDTSKKEFVCPTLGNALPIIAGTTYTIFATKGRYIQITNKKDGDKYHNGTSLVADYSGYVKSHLEKFIKFPKSGGPGQIKTYWNQCYTTIGDSVLISDVAQPLFYNINDSIDLQKNWHVTSIYVWKKRVVCAGLSFSTFVNASVASGGERTIDFNSNYSIVPGSMAEVLEDFWFMTPSGNIVPQSETIYGTIIAKADIATPVRRYLLTMKNRVCSWFDGRRYYIYWETLNEAWYTCVYDTLYKFWSVYTGIRPASFFAEAGNMYYIETSTWDVCVFRNGKVTDRATPLDQMITTKDIDLGTPFIPKSFNGAMCHFENKNQTVESKISRRSDNTAVYETENYTITQKIPTTNQSWTLWFNNVELKELVPQFKEFKPSSGAASKIWKWQLRSTGTNGFYLDQVAMDFNVKDKEFLIEN